MCGITGLLSPQGVSPYRSALIAAHDLVEHRGPDGEGFVLLDTRKGLTREVKGTALPDQGEMAPFTLALGHRRLAIVDLSPLAHQPMANGDRTLWITYNGEVYNYLELRAELEASGQVFRSASDTEVVLRAYEVWGEGCVERFNGMWAFAIADLKRQQIFCSRDRFGVKPFHYYYDGTRLVFGSEIKQLLAFPFVPKRVNERAVYEFLAHAHPECGEQTCFDGIAKLLPGHSLVLDLRTSGLKVARYYQPKLMIHNELTLVEAGEAFHKLLKDSVRLRLRSDVEVGSCLSGGLDSSSIVCLMRSLMLEQGVRTVPQTFSSHFEEAEANELQYAQTVIRETGVQAQIIRPTAEELLSELDQLVWHQEEPFGSTSIFAQWAVFKEVHRRGVKVMLDGQGADEQLAGYLWLAQVYFQELAAKGAWVTLGWETWCHARLCGKPWLPLLHGRLGGLFRRSGPLPAVNWIAPDLERRFKESSPYRANQRMTPFGERETLNNTLYQLTFFNNLPALLRYEDRSSMAFSVESRLPFLDYRLVEFLFGLPSAFKLHGGYTKAVLREGLAGVLPERIRTRVGKLGFSTPERLWLRTALRPLIEESLGSERMRPYLVPERARAHLRGVEETNLLDQAPWRWVSLYKWVMAYGLV